MSGWSLWLWIQKKNPILHWKSRLTWQHCQHHLFQFYVLLLSGAVSVDAVEASSSSASSPPPPWHPLSRRYKRRILPCLFITIKPSEYIHTDTLKTESTKNEIVSCQPSEATNFEILNFLAHQPFSLPLLLPTIARSHHEHRPSVWTRFTASWPIGSRPRSPAPSTDHHERKTWLSVVWRELKREWPRLLPRIVSSSIHPFHMAVHAFKNVSIKSKLNLVVSN